MKARHIYLLVPVALSAGPWLAYSSLEALAADVENYFTGTTAAIRAARRKTKGWPVTVKGSVIHKLALKGTGEIERQLAHLFTSAT